MSKKFSAARKRAFLTRLAESGNQSLAAERAKVSRSWVQLHRSSDAGFDAACREAIARAAERLGPSIRPCGATQDERVLEAPLPPTADAATPLPARALRESPSPAKGRGACAPPSGWAYFDGAELVVAGSNKRHRQVRRARVGQWTARVEERFLAALAASCNVTAACREAGMWPPSAYTHAKRWPAFAEAWDEAVEIGFLRIETALLEDAGNYLSGRGQPPLAPLKGMTVGQAIHLLHMHKHAVKGIGRAPGKSWRPPPSLDDPGMREGILRKLELIERMRRAEGGEGPSRE
jgi:hypothetical protein